MPIVLILFLVTACAPVAWPEPVSLFRPLGGTLALGCLLSLALVRFLLVSSRTLRVIRGPIFVPGALSSYGRVRRRSMTMLMLMFTVGLVPGGWGWTVQNALAPGSAVLPPGAELLVIAPFFAAVVASWLIFYPVEREVHHAPPLVAYLLYQFRQQIALALLPLCLVVGQQSVVRWWPEIVEQSWFQWASTGSVVVFLIVAPWLLRGLLGWRPLPAGPLRDHLMASARRLRLRFSDLMLWPTHGVVANAMVAGLLPRPRYIMMTDRLLHDLPPDELEAVLGHEIGHVRHRHMLLYFAFLGLSFAIMTGLLNMFVRILPADSWLMDALRGLGDWGTLASFAVAAVYILFAFGFISRRCEREADLFGCRAVSCGRPDCQGHTYRDRVPVVTTSTPLCPTAIETFAAALDRVADSNGMSRAKPGWMASWQHSTIEKRVAYLRAIKDNPAIERRFRRRMLAFKVLLFATLIGIVLLLAWTGDLAGGM
ncbi:MAG: M48 family metalloprotease [Gemmataceae bacterium]|nr:M48 family metalloprotease [Gemmataceae bacterium]